MFPVVKFTFYKSKLNELADPAKFLLSHIKKLTKKYFDVHQPYNLEI